MSSVEEGQRKLLVSTAPTENNGILVAAAIPDLESIRASRSGFQGIPHHKAHRNGDGVVDMPVHYCSPWGPFVGGGQSTSRCHISVHSAFRPGTAISILHAASSTEEPSARDVRDARHSRVAEIGRPAFRRGL